MKALKWIGKAVLIVALLLVFNLLALPFVVLILGCDLGPSWTEKFHRRVTGS
jgi:hypothetical protein